MFYFQGQGMTVGIMGSHLLCQCIQEQLEGNTQGIIGGNIEGKPEGERQRQLAALEGLPEKFHTQLSSLLEYPWSLSAESDAL